MRLITHNVMQCNKKGCGGFPLDIKLATAEELAKLEGEDLKTHDMVETELKPTFLKHIRERLEWDALVQAAAKFGLAVPANVTDQDMEDEDTLKIVHRALIELHILEGSLRCPKCNHEYPILHGIPNMVHNEED